MNPSIDNTMESGYNEHCSYWADRKNAVCRSGMLWRKSISRKLRGDGFVNTVVTSREAILNVSRELVMTQGWAAVNIRTVAAACNVSVGSIYNYFSSKSDLIAAAVESVWCDIFHFSENTRDPDSFSGCVEWVYDSMKKGDEKYPGFFTLHSMNFIGKEKQSGQQLMARSWEHMQKELYTVLMSDKNVRSDAFDDIFTPEKFVEIIFSLIISSLLQRSYDCSGILGMIRRVLYTVKDK